MRDKTLKADISFEKHIQFTRRLVIDEDNNAIIGFLFSRKPEGYSAIVRYESNDGLLRHLKPALVGPCGYHYVLSKQDDFTPEAFVSYSIGDVIARISNIAIAGNIITAKIENPHFDGKDIPVSARLLVQHKGNDQYLHSFHGFVMTP